MSRPPEPAGWESTPLTLTTDLDHGGRWTSLATSDREWLWSNPALAGSRRTVRPGDDFVDAGGAEECFPTIRGTPDHGEVWSRRWEGRESAAVVRAPGATLERRVEADDAVAVRYRITTGPGRPFLHALHVLLDVSPDALLQAPGVRSMQVLDHPEPGAVTLATWPDGTGVPLHRLGPDDGTATAACLLECTTATVVDGEDALSFAWQISGETDQRLCSLLLWRNLGGWPPSAPYRSIGVEPMVGRGADLATIGPEDAARADSSGLFTWTLEITAWRRSERPVVGPG